jgi:hypothetical protein
MLTLRRHFRKLIVAAVLTVAVSTLTIGSSANTYTMIAWGDPNGSFIAVSCGSSAGNY